MYFQTSHNSLRAAEIGSLVSLNEVVATTKAFGATILSSEAKIDFNVPAVLRKYPSMNGQPAKDVLWPNPYLVFDGTLAECIDQFLAKPMGQRRLYEIHTAAQADVVSNVMSSEHITELARLREFL